MMFSVLRFITKYQVLTIRGFNMFIIILLDVEFLSVFIITVLLDVYYLGLN